MSTSGSAAWLAGPAIAGVLVGSLGAGVAFAVDAASFAVSVAFLLALRVPDGPPPQNGRASSPTSLTGGARCGPAPGSWPHSSRSRCRTSPSPSSSCSDQVIVNEELGGATDWGLAMTIGATGGLAGSLLALRYRPARPLIPSFLVILFASVALLSLVPPVPAVAIGVASGLMFMGIQLGNALWHTMMQQHVPDDVLSRVSSYDWLVSLIFMPLGYTLAGPLADTIGLDTTLIAAAILSAAANLGVLLVPSVRALRRLDGPAPTAA